MQLKTQLAATSQEQLECTSIPYFRGVPEMRFIKYTYTHTHART